LCKSKRQKLENMKIGNQRAPTYLRRREEVAAAGRDPPPDLAVMVDNERQQAAEGLKRAVAMAGRGRRTKVGFLHTILGSVSCRIFGFLP
jgi:hypothetical protein